MKFSELVNEVLLESSKPKPKITDEADAYDTVLEKFRLVSVPKLIKLTKNRKKIRVKISEIWGGFQSSPGFSEKRVKETNTKYPILVDTYFEGKNKKYGLVDGRHRLTKSRRMGRKYCYIIKITKKDIDKAAIKN